MADSFTATLNLRKPEVGAANDTWGGSAGLNSDMDIIDAIFLATGLGTPVGLNIGAGKILNVAGEIQLLDGTDPTKVAMFDESLISTGTTRTFQFPDENGVLATQVDIAVRVPTGTIFNGYYGVAPPGFVMADGRTIGDATSGALNRANADTVGLFTLLWTVTSNAQCPVSGGRGASAAADFAAHKTLTLPNHSGRVMAGRDNLSGTAAGVIPGFTAEAQVGGVANNSTTVNSGGTNNINFGSPGFNQTGGSITTMGVGGLAFGGGGVASEAGDQVAVSGYVNVNGTFGINVSGSSAAFSIVQPTIAVDVIIAL